jgi:putative transposon-encoded protein
VDKNLSKNLDRFFQGPVEKPESFGTGSVISIIFPPLYLGWKVEITILRSIFCIK